MKTLVIGVLLVAGATSIIAADASGKWTIKMDKDFKGKPGCAYRMHLQATRQRAHGQMRNHRR